MAETIGFVGLGLMGSRMAARLIDAGFDLAVYNRTPDKAEPLIKRGARRAERPVDAAEGAAAVILMITDAAACREVLFGEGGLAKADGRVLVVNMSTLSPAESIELGETLKGAGHGYLEAPVSGSTPQAEAGKLVLLVGGDSKDLEQARGALSHIGEQILHVGPLGHGAAMKLIINMIMGVHAQAMAEALATGRAFGFEQSKVLEAMALTNAHSRIQQTKGPQVLAEDFAPRFPLKHQLKDLKLADAWTRDLEVPAPLVAAAAWTFERAVRDGLGDLDMAAICRYLMLD